MGTSRDLGWGNGKDAFKGTHLQLEDKSWRPNT